MSREYLGEIHADEHIRWKITRRSGGGCTLAQVREALLWPAIAETAWEDHPVHGRRLVALGTTADGRTVIAWLLPIPPWDPSSGSWIVKSARWV